MASKRESPATRVACRARKCFAVAAIVSENRTTDSNLQEHRAAWLARRFAISPDLAILLASLALGEARA